MTEEEEIAIEDLTEEFHQKVQRVGSDELDALGIQLDHMCGFFNKLKTVEDICRRFPQFHVFCSTELQFFNKGLPDAKYFYVGKGDRDPTLTAPRPQPSTASWGRALMEHIARVGLNPTDPEDIFLMNFWRQLASGEDYRDAKLVKRAREQRQDQ